MSSLTPTNYVGLDDIVVDLAPEYHHYLHVEVDRLSQHAHECSQHEVLDESS